MMIDVLRLSKSEKCRTTATEAAVCSVLVFLNCGLAMAEQSTLPPVTQQPVTQQPVTQQPVTQQPVTQQPVTQQPVTQQAIMPGHPVLPQTSPPSKPESVIVK